MLLICHFLRIILRCMVELANRLLNQLRIGVNATIIFKAKDKQLLSNGVGVLLDLGRMSPLIFPHSVYGSSKSIYFRRIRRSIVRKIVDIASSFLCKQESQSADPSDPFGAGGNYSLANHLPKDEANIESPFPVVSFFQFDSRDLKLIVDLSVRHSVRSFGWVGGWFVRRGSVLFDRLVNCSEVEAERIRIRGM